VQNKLSRQSVTQTSTSSTSQSYISEILTPSVVCTVKHLSVLPTCIVFTQVSFILSTPCTSITHINNFPQLLFSHIHHLFLTVPSEMMDRGVTILILRTNQMNCYNYSRLFTREYECWQHPNNEFVLKVYIFFNNTVSKAYTLFKLVYFEPCLTTDIPYDTLCAITSFSTGQVPDIPGKRPSAVHTLK
jgi:hypothetical protein